MSELSPVHQTLMAYYRLLMADEGGIPYRRKFNPIEIKTILPKMVLIEHSAPRKAVPRIVGSAVDEFLQASYTGHNLYDLWDDAHGDVMEAFYGTIMKHPCGGWTQRTVKTHYGIVHSYDILLLPFRNRDGDITLTMGTFAMQGAVKTELRFGQPENVELLTVNDQKYLDIGFGVPEPSAERAEGAAGQARV
ncbi:MULTISPECIES: PAS domain-containing protein [Kordiimonas]|uniref:PAS domain-containing protein n=1 Tax=Kordiimonas TaxID=288021 RepID=UPI00136662D1|nr:MULTISPECIES: PAS domain-containing protein [Kordiimonas]